MAICRPLYVTLRLLLLCVLSIFAVNIAVDIASRLFLDVNSWADTAAPARVRNYGADADMPSFGDKSWAQVKRDNAGHYGGPRKVRVSKESDSVPRTVHFIWFYPGNTTFRFHQAVCLISVQKHIRPERIFFWYDSKPVGPWWKFSLQSVPNLLLLHKVPPTSIFSRSVRVKEHQSDIARLDVLIKYGGIYMDLDVIALKSFDPLFRYDVTIGAETPNLLCSGVILSKRNSTFLNMWLERYRTFSDKRWNHHSGVVPMRLAKQHPGLIHIDWFSINRPNWFERDWLYTPGRFWDWSGNLAVHLWYQSYDVDHDPRTIRTLNTTVGEIFRYIYYGKPHILPAVA